MTFTGERLSIGHAGLPDGVEANEHRAGTWLSDSLPFCTGKNSGHGAISLLFLKHRPKRIALLGYDFQKTNGLHHFFGPHRHNLPNPSTFTGWLRDMAALEQSAKDWGVEIVNCSRESAIECFPRMTIEEWLARTTDDPPAAALSAARI